MTASLKKRRIQFLGTRFWAACNRVECGGWASKETADIADAKVDMNRHNASHLRDELAREVVGADE